MSRSWDRPEREVTPEGLLRSRRRWLGRVGLGAIGVGLGAGIGWWWWRDHGSDDEVVASGHVVLPGADLYPARPNPRFLEVDRPVTAEADAARYCNFYEFSSSKSVWNKVSRFQPVPWTLEVGGLVAKPRTFDLDDLVRKFSLEQRVYRHRCVEAWAMVVPWTGFPLAELLRKVEPLPGARYVRFVTFQRPAEAPRQGEGSFPWPYTEGLTLAEATNDLAFLATGMYGHPLLKQHGAPIRVVLPWKYGFKSAKSLVRIELTAEQPATFWNTVEPREYDFEANVNPAVPHRRWSQATERMLGTGERRPTQLYNGYGEWVGSLYSA
jgi:sulfoxide reductase catalytic subunit YedY